MPSALSWTASATIRSMASSRAAYIAWLSVVSSTDCFQPAYCRPRWYIDVPITRPRGTKPLSRTRMNSSTLRSEVKHLPWAVSARRPAPSWGTHCADGASVTVTPPTIGELARNYTPAVIPGQGGEMSASLTSRAIPAAAPTRAHPALRQAGATPSPRIPSRRWRARSMLTAAPIRARWVNACG